MSSYTTSAYDATPEIGRGYNAVVNGTYRIATGSVSLRDYDDTPLREASVYEANGIIRALDDIYTGKLTEYSSETRRMLDLAAGLVASDIDLDGFDIDGWADGVCTCYDLPDGRAHVCGNCLDASAARWGNEVPF